MGDSGSLTKILLPQDEDAEGIWTEPLGAGLYRLDNVPFQAYGFSWGDVVEAQAEAEDLKPVVTRVVRKSGHRTLRVILSRDASVNESLFRELREAGCHCERASVALLAIDVPSSVAVDRVEELLNRRQLRWEHADPSHDQVQADREADLRREMKRRLPVLAEGGLFPQKIVRDLHVEEKLLTVIGLPLEPREVPLEVRARPLLSAVRRHHGEAERIEERQRATSRGLRSELVHWFGRVGLVVPKRRPYRVERFILRPPPAASEPEPDSEEEA